MASYSWKDTPSSISLTVPLATTDISEDDVLVQIGPNFISISTYQDGIILEGYLSGNLQHTSCDWGLENGKIKLTLAKSSDQQKQWGTLFSASLASTGTGTGRLVRAFSAYETDAEKEIQFYEGELITVLKEGGQGWWKGRLINGTEGLFPSNFIEEIETECPENIPPEGEKTKAANPFNDELKKKLAKKDSFFNKPSTVAASDPGPPQHLPKKKIDSIGKCKCLHSYEATETTELSFHEGDIITILKKDQTGSGWWQGELNGQIGWFPENFVAEIHDKPNPTPPSLKPTVGKPTLKPLKPVEALKQPFKPKTTTTTNPTNTTNSTSPTIAKDHAPAATSAPAPAPALAPAPAPVPTAASSSGKTQVKLLKPVLKPAKPPASSSSVPSSLSAPPAPSAAESSGLGESEDEPNLLGPEIEIEQQTATSEDPEEEQTEENILADAPASGEILQSIRKVGGAAGRKRPSRANRKSTKPNEIGPIVAPPSSNASPKIAAEPKKAAAPTAKESAKVALKSTTSAAPVEKKKSDSLKKDDHGKINLGTTKPSQPAQKQSKAWPSELGSFEEFCQTLVGFFEDAKKAKNDPPAPTGSGAHVLPLFARAQDKLYGFSLCAVDGKTFQHGDSEDVWFSLGEAVWPFSLALAEETGANVGALVGASATTEPMFTFALTDNKKPLNAFTVAGHLAIASQVFPKDAPPARIGNALARLNTAAGPVEHLACSMPAYLSMLSSSNHTAALAYFLKSQNVFDKQQLPKTVLDLHYQLESVQVNCKAAAAMGATLATGGVCPLSGKKVFEHKTAEKVVSLLAAAGMNEQSQAFAKNNSNIPIKCSTSGCILIVIPNAFGLCIYSGIQVGGKGYSARGAEFARQLAKSLPSKLMSF